MKARSRHAMCRSNVFQRKALVLAIGSIALGFSGAVLAQATSGTIHGTVPVSPDEAVQITGGAGFSRTISVGPSGHFSVTLPVGTYTVSLLQNGKVVQSQTGVTPVAAGAVTVDFTSSAGAAKSQTLAAVNVTATAIPPIDVTTTNQVTTITAKQLQQLPLARNAEAIALLAPGVSSAAARLPVGPTGQRLLSFGGASDAENAYYMDGMNTTDMLTGQGGVLLPYGAIEQQQTFISGYGAKYGRSIGGVINQIGKSGTNEWHFGARAEWEPSNLQASTISQFWNNPRSTTPGEEKGDLRTYRTGDNNWTTVYDAYVGGPVIKNKLFFFVAAEADENQFNQVQDVALSQNVYTTRHSPKLYAKINWNINENNLFSLTGVMNKYENWSSTYSYDYPTRSTGAFQSLGETTKNSFRIWVANYTSFITDNLTLHAMLGKMHGEYYSQQPAFAGFDPTLPHIAGASVQNPAFLPPSGPVINSQSAARMGDPAHNDTVMNYRLSLDYKWRNHDFTAGIDNIQTWDMDDGEIPTGPGYEWIYQKQDPGVPLIGSDPSVAPYVGPPDSNPAGAGGYYVESFVFSDAAGVRVKQLAEYVEDNWQITPNLLLNLGLRNDTFVNYNPSGVPYVAETKPNWGPRLGFSWDVFGDSTLKVFGNAGRYYIAMPAGVALRGAGASTYIGKWFTYTGINPLTGEPTGLQGIPMNPATGVSATNEYGQPLNPLTVAARNAKAEYSDNFVLGGQWEFAPGWVAGATGTFQSMGPILDDWDDQLATCAAGRSEGLAYMTASTCDKWTQGTELINPGLTEDILVSSPSGKLNRVTVTQAQQGFPQKVKRNYYSLDLSLQHVWDGKWFARADYVFARSYGNTEGPVDSVIGQGGSSVTITEQWDFHYLMEWADGLQANNHKNTFKFYGAYAINPQWMVSANLLVQTGAPTVCLGEYGPNQTDPIGYVSSFHWCGGVPAPPGSTGTNPTIYPLDLGVDYRPEWAGHRLDFNLTVFNVLNEQHVLQYSPNYGTTETPSPTYLLEDGTEPPRTVRLTVRYDF